jgi:hypothetical protein
LKNWFWLGVILLFSEGLAAQTTTKRDTIEIGKETVITGDTLIVTGSDSLKNVKDTDGKKKFMPVPKTATRLALIPGMGQIYNRDYWKLPIVYIAFGGGLYTYYLNSLKYHDYLSAYKEFYDLDENSPTYGQIKKGLTADSETIVRVRNTLNTSSQYLPATRDRIAKGKNYWRRNRGFALIVTGLIYTLSIIEANVAAHLKTFDLSEDLSLRIEPKLHQPSMTTPTPGLRLVFNLK